MRSKLAAYITLIVLAIGAWIFYQAADVSSRGGEAPLYSSERYDPYGAAALRELLARRGVRTLELRHPYPDQAAGDTLIQILPAPEQHWFGDALSLGSQRLEAWMQQGNTVIEFTRWQTELMEHFGLETQGSDEKSLHAIENAELEGKPQEEIPAEAQDARWIADASSTGLAADLQRPETLRLYSPVVLQAGKESGAATAPASSSAPAVVPWHPLAIRESAYGKTPDWVAAVRPVGRGRLIVVGCPTPVLNGGIDQAENLEFVLALVGENQRHGAVLFDEWSHGIGHANTMIGFMSEVGLMPLIVQIIVVLLFYVWSTAGFRPRDKAGARRRRSSLEQTETLGYLYRQSLGFDIVFERVYTEVRRRLALALGCSPAAIESQLGYAKPEMARRAQAILAQAGAIGRGGGPTCPTCGYDLTHNTSGRCPECGGEIPLAIRNRAAEVSSIAGVPERQGRREKSGARLAALLRESHLFAEESIRVRKRDR